MSGPIFHSPGELPEPAGYSHAVSIPGGQLVWTSIEIEAVAAL